MNNRQQRLNFFLVVWFTMISFLCGWGQNTGVLKPKKDFLNIKYPGNSDGRQYPPAPLYRSLMVTDQPFQVEVGSNFYDRNTFAGTNGRPDGIYIQPANLYYLQSGFFCKREWELEKSTHIPFRFRLGSLADCNAMEGKN